MTSRTAVIVRAVSASVLLVGALAFGLRTKATSSAPATAASLVSLVALPSDTGLVVAVQVRGRGRINARLVPALEFRDGHVVRVAAGATDSIGDYFTEPPHAQVNTPRGTPVVVRASVCVDDEKLCRSVELATQLP